MELQIRFSEQATQAQLLNLKKEIDKYRIPELEKIDLDRNESEVGGMSGLGNFVGSLVALITAAKNPLTELVKCLQIYTKKYRTELEVIVGDIHVNIKSDNIKKDEDIVKSILEAAKELRKL